MLYDLKLVIILRITQKLFIDVRYNINKSNITEL